MSKYINENQIKGRPRKYDNPETLNKMKEQVYLYKTETPGVGIIKVAHMVKFSKAKHNESPELFPLFNKDAWSEYGIEFIKESNEPLNSNSVLYEVDPTTGIINFTETIEQYAGNTKKLISVLAPQEIKLHEALWNEQNANKEIIRLNAEIAKLKEKLKNNNNLIELYEQYTMSISHLSKTQTLRQTYGLAEIMTIDTKENNLNAIRNLDNLSTQFPPCTQEEKITMEPIIEEPSSIPSISKISNHANRFRERRKNSESQHN